ncbi:MAG: acetylglutamate kinase, partial [Dermatophilaceae bacterium]
CVRAVEAGVPQAHVVDGRQPHSILLEVFTSDGIGTMVLPDPDPDPDRTPARTPTPTRTTR